ncbi:MAG: VanZ family protein [Bacteroidia bacterium]|nr:VanZ family protein [Bacteroidia bacterium]
MKQNRIYHYRFAIAWAMLILFACGASPGTLSELKLEDLFGYDKPIHALLFGLQAWLLIQANFKHSKTSKHTIIVLWCSVSAVFGALIELMQKFIFTGRSYDYFDMLANALGCLIVYFIAIKKYKNV